MVGGTGALLSSREVKQKNSTATDQVGFILSKGSPLVTGQAYIRWAGLGMHKTMKMVP